MLILSFSTQQKKAAKRCFKTKNDLYLYMKMTMESEKALQPHSPY
jgi:hypothetical protein